MSATKRSVFNVRLAPDALERVRALAEDETEGNASLMLRKLLSEALEARAADMAAGPTTQLANSRGAVDMASTIARIEAEQARERSAPAEPVSPPVKPTRKAVRAAEPQEDVPAGQPVRSQKTMAQILKERAEERLRR